MTSHEKKTLTPFIITHYRDNTCGIGVDTLTSFKNTINMKTRIAVARKAQKFLRISTHLMMAKYTETCSAVTNFKKGFNFKS
jgi:hypothetical protein